MRERKKLLSKTLNSRMNIIETRAVLNIVKTDGKWAPEGKREGKREGLKVIRRCFKQLCIKKINSRMNTKKVSSRNWQTLSSRHLKIYEVFQWNLVMEKWTNKTILGNVWKIIVKNFNKIQSLGGSGLKYWGKKVWTWKYQQKVKVLWWEEN